MSTWTTGIHGRPKPKAAVLRLGGGVSQMGERMHTGRKGSSPPKGRVVALDRAVLSKPPLSIQKRNVYPGQHLLISPAPRDRVWPEEGYP